MVRHNTIPVIRIQLMAVELDIIPSSGQRALKYVRQIYSQRLELNQLSYKIRKPKIINTVIWRIIKGVPYKMQANTVIIYFFKDIVCLFWRDSPQWARPFSFTRFLDHTQRRTTVGRTPLDERSARRRDLYLTTHNTHVRHPCLRWDSNPQSQQASGRRPTP
jgi:hypothetical protein